MLASRYRLAVLVGALVLVLAACEIQLEVDIDVAEDGSGIVTAGVGLNDDALRRIGDVDSALRTADLEATGWAVAPPEIRPDGLRWYAAAKPFSNPEQLQEILDELSGPNGAFQDFEITRTSTREENVVSVVGSVDLSGGIDIFSDDQLAALLDDPPLGVPVADVEQQIGDIERAIEMRVVVQLPGEDGQTFTVPLGDSAQIEAEAKDESQWGQVLRWVGFALLALFGLSVLLAIAGIILDRRYEEEEGPRTPAPVRERVPVPDRDPGGEQPAAVDDEDVGAARLQLVVLGAPDVVFERPAEPGRWLVGYAHEHGSVLAAGDIAEAYRQATLGRLSAEELWERLRVVGDPANLDAGFLADVRVRPTAKEFVREMQRRSLPVAVIDNEVASWSHRLRAIHGLQRADYWMASGDIGARAPDPALFEAVRRMADLPFSRCLMVAADRSWLDTAKSLGMITALYVERRPSEDEDLGHPVVTSFADFFRRRRPDPAARRRRRPVSS